MGFRRSSPQAPIFWVLTDSGLVIDIEGVVPGLMGPVSIPMTLPYDRPSTVVSAIREPWRLLGHKVKGGVVILGIPLTDATANLAELDSSLLETAKNFGSSLEEALVVTSRDINGSLDYAVVDASSHLRNVAGGIPLQTDSNLAYAAGSGPVRHFVNEDLYIGLSDPILDTSGHHVGQIVVFKNISAERKVLNDTAFFNLVVAGISWCLSVGLLWSYLPGGGTHDITCERALALEESATVEFKSSLRWDYARKLRNDELAKQVVKTVVAFLNTIGGALIIGLDDHRSVLGLDHDYEMVRGSSRDGFQLTLKDLMATAMRSDTVAEYVRVGFCSFGEKDICIVNVSPARRPIFCKEGDQTKFYVRLAGATAALDAQQQLSYIKDHWSWWRV